MYIPIEDYCPMPHGCPSDTCEHCYWCGSDDPDDDYACRIYMMLRDDKVYG